MLLFWISFRFSYHFISDREKKFYNIGPQSCIIYSHVITATGIIGVSVVFGATFLRIYCGYRFRKRKQALKTGSAPAEVKT
jgi:hypothetical protein